MAIVKIEQTPLQKYGDELVLMVPKPPRYQRRIPVEVPEQVVKDKEVQPVLDAYAKAVKKPDWVGKNADWYKEEQHLVLGFHLVSFDDGSSIEPYLPKRVEV